LPEIQELPFQAVQGVLSMVDKAEAFSPQNIRLQDYFLNHSKKEDIYL
jgi:hypothetical protein